MELRPPAKVGAQGCVVFVSEVIDSNGQIPTLTTRGKGHLSVDNTVGGLLIEVIDIVEEFARVVIDRKPVEAAA